MAAGVERTGRSSVVNLSLLVCLPVLIFGRSSSSKPEPWVAVPLHPWADLPEARLKLRVRLGVPGASFRAVRVGKDKYLRCPPCKEWSTFDVWDTRVEAAPGTSAA